MSYCFSQIVMQAQEIIALSQDPKRGSVDFYYYLKAYEKFTKIIVYYQEYKSFSTL